MNAKMIESLPNITQNPLQYAMLQAGAVGRPATQDTTSVNSFGIGVDGRRQWSAVGVNGGRAFTNDIQLDGLPVMGGGYNEASVVPNTEGLQEVRVISNNFTAEYGRGQAVISMSTKSGTNRFTGQAPYMGRHEGLDANTFQNNAQRIEKRPFRVSDLGGTLGGPILKQQAVLLHQLPPAAAQQHDDDAADGADRARARRRLQPDARPERERPAGAGAHLRSVQRRRRQGPDLYRRVEIPNARIPNPNPAALWMYSFYPLPNRTPGRRLQHQQLRGVDRPDDPPLQLEQPRRLPHRPPLDLRQRRHLLRRDHHAAPVRRVAVQRRRRRPRRRQPVRADRRRGRARADAAARRPLRRQPHQHQEPERRQDRASTTTTRSACPRTCSRSSSSPARRPNVNPNGFAGGAAAAAATTGARSPPATSTPSASTRPATASRRAPPRRAAPGSTRPASSSATCSRTTPIPSRARWRCRRRSRRSGGNFNFEYVDRQRRRRVS